MGNVFLYGLAAFSFGYMCAIAAIALVLYIQEKTK